MDFPLYKTRFYLYWSFLLWTILLFALTVARLSYTENLPKGDPLNGGRNFYDPSVVALLVSAILGLIFAPFMIYTLNTHFAHPYFTTVAFEVATLVLLWILLLGSAAAATNVWPDLSFCVQYRACTNLQAMIGFAWLGWISLTIIILITVVAAMRYNVWHEYSHGPWADMPLIWRNGPRVPTSDFERASGPMPQMRATEDV